MFAVFTLTCSGDNCQKEKKALPRNRKKINHEAVLIRIQITMTGS